jgi:hypothetical protein
MLRLPLSNGSDVTPFLVPPHPGINCAYVSTGISYFCFFFFCSLIAPSHYESSGTCRTLIRPNQHIAYIHYTVLLGRRPYAENCKKANGVNVSIAADLYLLCTVHWHPRMRIDINGINFVWHRRMHNIHLYEYYVLQRKYL